MRAVRWHAAGDVRLEETELELDLGSGMVEAEVRRAGICGSDLAEYRSPMAIRPGHRHLLSGQEPPVTLGHEFSGVVTAVGDSVVGVAVGDRVAADACWRCNQCEACVTGHYNLCKFGGSIGLVSDGAFAPRVRFPAYCAVSLPDGVGDEEGALLEPLAVGLHALDRGSARAGDSVAILGFGPIGACTALMARSLGIEPLVCEPHPGRRARAESMGFTVHAPSGTPAEVAKQVRGLTGGGAQVVVDCSGARAALAAAPDMTPRGGRVVVAGVPKEPLEIDGGRLVLFERTLLGTLGYVHDLPRVAKMIDDGHLDPGVLVTRRIDLSETPAEIARLAADPGDDLKVMVKIAG